MEQHAWTLSHHIGERPVRRGYHLGMPTRHTNQLFLKPQSWQSSDQIEFTQERQKGQSSSDPTSYATSTTHSKNQPRNNAQPQKTEKNKLKTPNPQERPYR
jgi:hypothetical protein